jgi:hypothetical protein
MTTELRKSDLRFATRRAIDSVWVIAYAIDIEEGTAHIYGISRDFAIEDLVKSANGAPRRCPTYSLVESQADGDVTGIRVFSNGGECTWEVANPRGRYEYDAMALVEALVR